MSLLFLINVIIDSLALYVLRSVLILPLTQCDTIFLWTVVSTTLCG